MVFDTEQNIEKILKNKKSRNWALAEHLRLLGFHHLIENSSLDKYRVEEYISKIATQFPSFTRLTSGSFLLANRNLIEQEKLSSIHLPFNKNYHLLFYLVSINEFMQEFFYDSCSDCKLVSPHKFPIMELRQSVNLESFKGECIMYDNRESILRQEKSILKEQYDAVKNFVENTKI